MYTKKSGDLVPIKNNNKHSDKYTSAWNITPLTILKTKGNNFCWIERADYSMIPGPGKILPFSKRYKAVVIIAVIIGKIIVMMTALSSVFPSN